MIATWRPRVDATLFDATVCLRRRGCEDGLMPRLIKTSPDPLSGGLDEYERINAAAFSRRNLRRQRRCVWRERPERPAHCLIA